ncbi:MAG: IMP cyclohydrolase, partial [Spirochaetales bacterium]|nr:IMP cyclohydrolase [Spirochaetales bacterium]
MADLKKMYHEVQGDSFPPHLEISFLQGDEKSTLRYEKVQWTIGGETLGLRYGENPGQEAALYRPVTGNLSVGGVEMLLPGKALASDIELLQSGKHPGKTNITDIDGALNIMKYLTDTPCAVIVKHNNPCGVALGESLPEAYSRAYFADRIAAFGGAVAVNREMDRETASLIAETYVEVVAAPEYAPGAVDILAGRKNLRILRISAMDSLRNFRAYRYIDFTSLMDGGLILQ